MKEAYPDFRVNVYGNDPNRLQDVQQSMALSGPRGGGGGFPWFSRNSPTYPNGPQGSAPPPAPGTTPNGPPPDVAGVFAGLTARDWMALAAAVAGITGGALSSKPNMTPNTMTQDPQLQELLAMMSGRLKKSEPLFDSIQSMANGLLPTQYQKGGGGMG